MTQKTIAEVFVETMIAAGVTRIYGVVSDSLNGILEEIRRSKQIDWIGVRHEETAAFAAGGQAQFRGGLAGSAGGCCAGQIAHVKGLPDCYHRSVDLIVFSVLHSLHESAN